MNPEFKRLLLYISKKSGEIKMLKCIVAIIQDAETRDVLMQGFMDQFAWDKTQKTKMVHLWSTSRDELWFKGGESGNKMEIVSQHLDCDFDAVLIGVKVVGDGFACHMGRISCFYNEVS